ncbi:MAG: TetR/AcrR family transcriptional regulator [Azospirillaceae bacterium]|nr:TetR/AcrR family transcriptional regulator [Azospirillaceae bacterium]
MAQGAGGVPRKVKAASSAKVEATTPPEGGIRRENLRRILTAAEQIFAEQGYGGATTAAIALRAGLPKANVHYYFSTKRDLYRAVLADILKQWLDPLAHVTPDSDPAQALAGYIRAKMRATRDRPVVSKVFAGEIIHGAEEIWGFLTADLKSLVDEKAAVLDGWIAEGRMAPVDTKHFFFFIWAVTQHYADFDAQVRAVLGRKKLTRRDFDAITIEVVRFILRGAGLSLPNP